ncbi:MAG: cell division protein FtsA [Candidatus Levybacteria bacterium RIFCSPHIGHO2_01_FULL_36_15]|nr:MAG: cell division protein FtsA [Candidatus Levybacteria bacterium RIFCSPHIGHO2_01_FULL_36_15]OGH37959.1 MAG: cell division protein FtsA [Candidatus Levybacteria bacterium RIFCSPLOWO2_01_FULL_36_10]
MRDSNIIVGADIGTSKIATVIAQVQEEGINILGVSEVASRGIRKGQIVDIEEASSALNASLNTAERMAGYSIDKVFCSISGLNIESQNSKGVVAVSQPEGEIIYQDVDRVLEAASAISLPSTKSILHVVPRTFTVDGEPGIKDPVGMNGVRLEVDTHIITANSTTIKNIQKVLEAEAGVELRALVFSGYASSQAVLTDTEKELGVILVDIGAGVTNIAIFVEGALSYSSVIPIGAKHITNDIAIGLRVSLESAEKIKLFLSKKQNRKSKYDKDEDTSEIESDDVDLGSLRLIEEVRKVSKKTLVEGIIRPRLNEIFTMVLIELKKSGFLTQTPAGVVITGGGAKTVGAVDAAKRMLSMPVRIGMPYGMTGLIDEVEDPSFSTVCGLVMFGKNYKASEPLGIMPSFIPSLNLKFLSSVTNRLKKILKSFLP